MGVVYRATHGTLQRDVAIEVLPPDFATDPERRRRFEHEARAASTLNQPAFVTIHDIDVVEDTRYIAMELVEGRTLREHLRDCAERSRRRSTLSLSWAALAAGLLLIFAAGSLGAWRWLRVL